MKRLFIQLLFIVLLGNTPALCQVYKYTNSDGVVTYTTSKPDESAQPATLPPILREKNTAGPLPLALSCTSHGGIDCQAGADVDGSVICLDGFKEAIARFKFRCSATKLSVVELETNADKLSVWVRNEKDVTAEEVQISLVLADGNTLIGQGPASVEPSELAEYTFNNMIENQVYTTAQVNTQCGNCG